MRAADIFSPSEFSAALFEAMPRLNPAVADMELDEFRYALEGVTPPGGWNSVALAEPAAIEARVSDRSFYAAIRLKMPAGAGALLDEPVLCLTQMLFVGLVTGRYDPEWIARHFFFDLRGFFFLHRTRYFSAESVAHLGGQPYRAFEPRQRQFDRLQSVGYKAFQAANAEVDGCLIDMIHALVARKGTPILIAIAGPTAAGKTEIVARLRAGFEAAGRSVTAVEMDHFLTDRDEREASGIDSLGKEALHYPLFLQCLSDLGCGQTAVSPRYDFILATSSHDNQGRLRAGCEPVIIEPADVIFLEGNFPFLLPEVADRIGIKVVYLTDDDVRLKRKWKRDMDYRKKYQLSYFLNRYFREQFLMAAAAYIPQLETCDLAVDTTRAEIWATPAVRGLLAEGTGQAAFNQGSM